MANPNQAMYNAHGATYHAKRGREADSSWNRYLDQPMIEKLLTGLPCGRVADLGCGSGLLTRWLNDKGFDAVGADFSESLIDIARQENPSLEFSIADIKATPYPANAFDLVTSALVIHYEPELHPVFAEMARILKPGGQAVFSMHHPMDEVCHGEPDADGARRLMPYFHNDSYSFEMADMQLTAYHHTFEDIAEALHANGFVIERLLEARMPDSVKDKFPHYHERTNRYPSFVGFRVKLADPNR